MSFGIKIRVIKLIADKLNDAGFQTDVCIECTSGSGTDSKHMKCEHNYIISTSERYGEINCSIQCN